MVQQYLSLKEKHKDAILFFRLGDFYEMFNEDALLASRELELTLTGRGQEENRMPMCGIPYHAAAGYIAKLIEKGYKVAICEQVEDPKVAKGVVKREVVKIITPGTVLESSMLVEKSNNYLCAVSQDKGLFAIAYVDVSTGEFCATQIDDWKKLLDEIERISPAECLISDMLAKKADLEVFLSHKSIVFFAFKDIYEADFAAEKIKEHFKIASLESFGLSEKNVILGPVAAILDYLKETQKTNLVHLNNLKLYIIDNFMLIDAATRRNLELTKTIRDKSFRGSLLWVLDKCQTAMGSRALKKNILQPLLDEKEINQRLDGVEALVKGALIRDKLTQLLKKVFDIERLTAKVASAAANAKDLVALKESLKYLPAFKDLLKDSPCDILKAVAVLPNLSVLEHLIEKAITDDPPHTLKDAGLIKDGYSAELDEIKKAARNGKEWISNLENKERLRTGIKSLKVGFNKIFGYYIEISNSNLESVPADYIRKQTLVNAERFITPDLKEQESLILNADERLKQMEYEIFVGIRAQAAEFTKELQLVSLVLAQVDVLLSLAQVAIENNYIRPEIRIGPSTARLSSPKSSLGIKIMGSRHPVVEKTIGEYKFVANDIDLDDEENRFLLITGPNMGGKSTFMRQVALISLMAQIGSFVPAKEANLCLVDRIFTRIGAMDDIFSGQSTFMLEMTETANILNNATDKSLVILDEIGRGTATFDGMSIAAAVAEYIHTKIKAKTLFATHYHEITQLADKHKAMKNINVAVKEDHDRITFLYKIKAGPADKSYGIQVARLAGLPAEVISRAKEVYETLEMVENDMGKKGSGDRGIKVTRGKGQVEINQMGMF